jgi:hypothetical protein
MAIMDRDEFWAIVDRARDGVDDTRTGEGAAVVAERVGDRLTELGRDAAVAFDLRYGALRAESYDWNLWGAAYLMEAAPTTPSTTSAAGSSRRAAAPGNGFGTQTRGITKC